QFRPRARPARTGDDHSEEVAKKLSRRVHAQLASGRDDRFTQDLEAPNIFQSDAEINFFGDKVLLIEASSCLEIASCREKKRTSAEIEPKIKRAKRSQQNATPTRNESIDRHTCAAARVTSFQSGDPFDNVLPADPRIGYH